jgi:NitT/TauT family transport system substrate-binding protein
LAEQALLDGVVEVLWAGPMRVMKHHDENPNSPLVCFAEVVCRDPFSIVGRYPNPDFRLADLARMRIATVSEVPTPWLCLQEDLRQAGIDPARLDRVADRSMAENLNALGEGRIEAAQFFEPFVEEALTSGRGHLWYAASTRGRTTYTAFVTTRDRLVGDTEPLLPMVRAIRRSQQWIHARSAPEIAAAIISFFPALDLGVLAAALARYQAQSVWGHDPVLPEDGFDRLRRSLVSGGFIRRPTEYAACVDNGLAQRALTK